MNRFELLKEAALGSREAQAQLVDVALNMGNSGQVNLSLSLFEAEMWARIAAAHGDWLDITKHMQILVLKAQDAEASGNREAAMEYQAEALALADFLADHRSDRGEQAATEIAGMDVIPELARRAGDYRAMWKE